MNLPEPGTEAVYRGLNVVVATVKKRGRGYQVHYTTLDGQAHIARLKDWRKGVQ
jgi:hypothetical protein